MIDSTNYALQTNISDGGTDGLEDRDGYLEHDHVISWKNCFGSLKNERLNDHNNLIIVGVMVNDFRCSSEESFNGYSNKHSLKETKL